MSKILFIGSFIKLNNESGTGGQLCACTILLESDFLNKFEFVLVDSTSKLPIPNLVLRLLKAIKRLGLLSIGLNESKDSAKGSMLRKTHQIRSLMMFSGWIKMYNVDVSQ
jgi:hypothetical protein